MGAAAHVGTVNVGYSRMPQWHIRSGCGIAWVSGENAQRETDKWLGVGDDEGR